MPHEKVHVVTFSMDWFVHEGCTEGPSSDFLCTTLSVSLFPAPPPFPFHVCLPSQSGWQCAAVGEPVRVISHVELGQDLDVPK